MIDHPAARKLSFTGSTPVGRSLAKHAGERLLRTSMELGGDNAFIVFDDADLEAALDGAMMAKLRNIGEACTAANRFLVHRSLIDAFAAKLAERMAAQKMGPGLAGGELGPLIDGKARGKVDDLVKAAVAGGAKALTGGSVPEGPGYFYPPTVLVDVPKDAEILRTEIFGPVATLQAFDTEDEAIERANASDYGLTAYVYTRDLSRALRVIDQLEVGMIGLNRGMVSNPAAPFGGIKASGLGREGGAEGIEEYLSVKYASIAL
jgi:succinate-semialdehyde dehydrogenase/glutarate-semialdehyde dehydrogenase